MDSLGFTRSNTLTDVRLAIGFLACAIAAATFYGDYKLGADSFKGYTVYAVAAYFTLNTFLTWWIWGVEGAKVYTGSRNGVKVRGCCPPLARRRSRRQVILETHADKYSPVYEVKVTTVAAGTKSVATAKNAFAGWFDQQGYFVENPFRAFIRNAVPVLAEDAAGKK